MARFSVLLAFIVVIGIASALPTANQFSSKLKRTSDLLKSGRALGATKKDGTLSELDNELRTLVDLLKREYSGQKAAGQQHAAVQQETRRQQENQDDTDDEDEHCDEKCRVDVYFWTTVDTVAEGSAPSEYYKTPLNTRTARTLVILNQQEILLKALMQVVNDCNGDEVYTDIDGELENIMEQARSSYNYINADWDAIEVEFGVIEEAYNQKKNQAEQVAKDWPPVCWFTTKAMDTEMQLMHRAVYSMKGFEHWFIHGQV